MSRGAAALKKNIFFKLRAEGKGFLSSSDGSAAGMPSLSRQLP